MALKQKVAGTLYSRVNSGGWKFNRALKIYGAVDPVIARNLSNSGKFMRKKLIGHILNATDPKNRMAWTSIGVPCELLSPFGIYPLTLEVLAGLFATTGLAKGFLDDADSKEVPNTMCSFHRVLMGLSDKDYFGKPNLVAATSILCDGNVKTFDYASRAQNVPFFYIDVPFENSEKGLTYLKDQLHEFVSHLEKITGKKLDINGLKRRAKLVNEAFFYSRKYYNLRRETNLNIYQGHEIANMTFPFHFLLGSQLLVDILREHCSDLEKKKSYNKFYSSLITEKGAQRLMWLHIVPQYSNDLWKVIDDGVHAKIVCDEYSSPYFDDYNEDDLIGSVAKRLINHPANGPIENRIRHVLKVAKDFSVDGIIHYSSWGCHQAAGNIGVMGRAIQDAGYKFLNLNSDPVDPTNGSIEQHRTRLEAFLEN